MKSSYRPDIDGLRGLSVIAVIFYHANLSLFGHKLLDGGYLGVDVFFVISGYVITSMMINEFSVEGKINILNFYNRRVRRLLPNLILVISVTTIFSFFFFYPSNFVEFLKSAFFSIFFISNHYFAFSNDQYAAINSQLNPLLHTWSLSIEEQFYIFFPLFFIIFFRNKLNLIFILTIISTSIYVCYFFKFESENLKFYFAFSRIWEILFGCLAAVLNNKHSNIVINKNIKILLLLFVIACFFLFDDETSMPNYFLIFPVLASTLLVFPHQRSKLKNNFYDFLISNKIMISVGLLSYSLYLWHFPIFSFFKYLDFFNEGYFRKILIGCLIILISLFSYFFVEKPFRNIKLINDGLFYSILSIFVFIFLILFYFSNKTNGFLYLNNDLIINSYEPPPWNISKQDNKNCFKRLDNFCHFVSNKNNKTIILLGDSHAASFQENIKEKLINKFNIIMSTGEPFYLDTDRINKSNLKIDKNFSLVNKYRKKIIIENPNAILIIAQRFPLHLNETFYENKNNKIINKDTGYYYSLNINEHNSNFFEKFINDLNLLSKDNKIILINPIPEVGFDVRKKLYLQFPKNKSASNEILKQNKFLINTPSKNYYERNLKYFSKLKNLSDNIIIVNFDKYLCNNFLDTKCILHDDNDIFYYDNNHLSQKGSEELTNLILKKIK